MRCGLTVRVGRPGAFDRHKAAMVAGLNTAQEIHHVPDRFVHPQQRWHLHRHHQVCADLVALTYTAASRNIAGRRGQSPRYYAERRNHKSPGKPRLPANDSA